MKQRLTQIYRDLSEGKLTQKEALDKIKTLKLTKSGILLSTPVWEENELLLSNGKGHVRFNEHHILLCELSNANNRDVEQLISDCHCVSFQKVKNKNVAERFLELTQACFELIKKVLKGRPTGKVLIQVVIPNGQEEMLFAGISSLIKTVELENPQIIGQVISTTSNTSVAALVEILQTNKTQYWNKLIKYDKGIRTVSVLKELEVSKETSTVAFKDYGVYLITGGMGGIGFLFAKEIIKQTAKAKLILVGRSELTPERKKMLTSLSASGRSVTYRRVDITNAEQVNNLIASIRSEHKQLNGILHCAGINIDNFILKKSLEEFQNVLQPKVVGLFNLDRASANLDLDFVALFSSVASWLGNVGQVDYATANGFMDQFAIYRNALVKNKERKGQTLSINWPLWQEGGMSMHQSIQKTLEDATGLRPLEKSEGFLNFYRGLASGYDQIMVMAGDYVQIRDLLSKPHSGHQQALSITKGSITHVERTDLFEKAQTFICKQLAGQLKLSVNQLDPRAPLERYGIDSILSMDLTSQLEKTFGSLPKTLFFEYQTIHELTAYFVNTYTDYLTDLLFEKQDSQRLTHGSDAPMTSISPIENSRIPNGRFIQQTREAIVLKRDELNYSSEPIAIIGLSGSYPEAKDLQAYWQNLRDGKDCIVEIPKERWNWQAFYTDDRTKSGHYSKWGGFVEGVDEFDPRFFNISPQEAKVIDPQERIFLQQAWKAIEDAGYTRDMLQKADKHGMQGQVGVYVGVMYGEYQLFSAQSKDHPLINSYASIANRVSYVLNIHGPSMTLDTMCSSSLTAVHLACQDLKLGRTGLAIAGGVNVSIHPNKYLFLSEGQFISSDGHCQSFGEGGDGYIPGEGVGVVILKRLSEAVNDGDHIYGVIRGSALNHGGKTNGYSVPNPQAQAAAISHALSESAIDARHISYIEAHGTGTKLGDPIEIAALSQAFKKFTEDKGFCLIGSAKSNIGHCESAAGIAGLTKVLLQMQYQQIVPSLHSAKLNPYIDFPQTPFIVNQKLTTWEQPWVDGKQIARIAGVSSFGAGGSNAHLIVEEYRSTAETKRRDEQEMSVIVPLSARTKEQLKQKAHDLLNFLHKEQPFLIDTAYTLQTGREAMQERLGFIVSSIDQLAIKLQAYINGELIIENTYQGQVKRHQDMRSFFDNGTDLRQTLDNWITQRKWAELLDLWVKGMTFDWNKLYDENKPKRISLPSYPFAKEKYWVELEEHSLKPTASVMQTMLHPLLHVNISDMMQQRYRSTFSGKEIFFADYQEAGQKILLEAAYLEMARIAVEKAIPATENARIIELYQLVWGEPFIIKGKEEITITLFAKDIDQVDFQISSKGSVEDRIHFQGHARFLPRPIQSTLDIAQLQQQSIQKVDELLTTHELPDTANEHGDDLSIHPTLINNILEAASGLSSEQLSIPIAMESIGIIAACEKEMIAWIRYAVEGKLQDGILTLDIDLLDQQGNVCIYMRGVAYQRDSVAMEDIVKVRKKIYTTPSIGEVTAPEKPTEISVHKLYDLSFEKINSIATQQRAPIVLSDAANNLAVAEVIARSTSLVDVYDDGNGIFSIQIVAENKNALSEDLIDQLLEALNSIQQEPHLKVLILRGTAHSFCNGGRAALNQAIERKLYQAIVSFPYPTIAVMQGDANGAGFLIGALCDFMICNEDSTYHYTDLQKGLFPSSEEYELLEERFGEPYTTNFLYFSKELTGEELKKKGWTIPIVPGEQIEVYTQQLALSLLSKSDTSLHLLRMNLARHMNRLSTALKLVEPFKSAEKLDKVYQEIASPNVYIQLNVHDHDILIVNLVSLKQEYEIKFLIADLSTIFNQVNHRCQYKSIIITSDHPDFLPHIPETVDAKDILAFKRLVLETNVPVIVALNQNVKDLFWFMLQFCDACIYSEEGKYAITNVWKHPKLAKLASMIFTHRFGNFFGKEIILTGAEYTGISLQRRTGALNVVPKERVLPVALQLASYWANEPLDGIIAWKKQQVLKIKDTSDKLPTWSVPKEERLKEPSIEPISIRLASEVILATAHPEGILVVKMEDRQAKNMFSDAFTRGLIEVFEHVAQTESYKVVILTGFDNYFASGGTKETLLAIQEGRVRFTDVKIYELAMKCNVPVIAAIQGHAIGAGWALGMFADFILLSEESKYVSPYMNYGFTPGAGATFVFSNKVGYDLARETLLTAREYAGHELKERGLRLPILPREEVNNAALELARKIANCSRSNLIALKHQWTHHLHKVVEETYDLELAMHEKTFVRQSHTFEQINDKFNQAGNILQEGWSVTEQSLPSSSLVHQDASPAIIPQDTDSLAIIIDDIRQLLARELHLDEHEIDENTQFIDIGLDSIIGVTWIRRINEKYKTSIEATKIYTYPTLVQLGRFIKEEAKPSVIAVAEPMVTTGNSFIKTNMLDKKSNIAWRPTLKKLIPWVQRSTWKPTQIASSFNQSQQIAVIGMAGQFPMAKNIDEFWQNIAQGKDCIRSVPKNRWDVDAYYQKGEAKSGKTNSMWAGMLDEFDLFDPLFFNISPVEAASMDPQQRVLLQTCWHSIENAGYNPKALSGSKCGVYIGCASGDYQLLSRELQLSAQGFTGGATSILAARISYLLNLQGPCLSIDTACSSSLVAIATACDNLVSGSCDTALAGGVYVMVGPDLHIKSAQSGMLSPDGKCYTFDSKANGFVPGEGVGVVMLKRLVDAQKDNDIIYGVIQGWGVNQDGKTNGITAPSEESQSRLEQDLYDKFQIDPNEIQLIEAHGTGTKLGDPIELNALKDAFRKYTSKKDYCAIGSVKSNIGHCLTAAGVAGFIKTLLALKHRQLPPTINYDTLNEHTELKDSPFYINSELQKWETTDHLKRQAAISSFGFSGTNAHIVVGEYIAPQGQMQQSVSVVTQQSKMVVPISARTTDQLQQKLIDLLDFICQEKDTVSLLELAYTLQIGRDAMGERLAFMVSSMEQLEEKLRAYLKGERNIQDVYEGKVKSNKEGLSVINRDDDLKKTIIDTWITQKKLSKLVDLWVKGMELDWNRLYGKHKPSRLRLPTYPFAKERYWFGKDAATSEATISSQWDQLSHICKWEVQSSLKQKTVNNHQSILIVCTGPCFHFETVVQEFYKQQGECNVVLLRIADRTEKLSEGEWSYDARNPAAVQRCLQEIDTVDAFYFIAIDEQHANISTLNELVGMQEHNEIQLLRIVKGLKKNNKIAKNVDTYIITLDNYALDLAVNSSFGAGAAGLGYSLAQGNYQFLVRNIDLSSSELKDLQKQRTLFEAIYHEPFSNRGEIFKLQSGRRYRQEFFKLNWDPSNPSLIKNNGVYLIVGGSGTVGKIISKNLIQKYNAQVIWIGRSAIDSEKVQTTLQTCKEFTSNVSYFQADVKHQPSMQHVIEKIKEQFGRIHGAVFAGMVFNFENSIDETTEDEFRSILEVKTQGCWVFHKVLEKEKLDFMCYFSSGQAYSFSGASRLSAYAAAIASADRLVQSLITKSEFPVGIINWGFWNSSVDVIVKDHENVSTSNLDALEDVEGFNCFERFVSELKKGRVNQVLCIKISPQVELLINRNQHTFITLTKEQSGFTSLTIEASHKEIEHELTARQDFNKLPNMDSAESSSLNSRSPKDVKEYVSNIVLSCLTQTLAIASEEIDSEIAFSDYGIDSILGANFINQLNSELSIALNAAVIFEYASIDKLSDYIFTTYRDQLAMQRISSKTESSFFEKEGWQKENEDTRNIFGELNSSSNRVRHNGDIPQIAIVGMSGMMPKANDIDEFWSNIIKGVDGVDELPPHYLDHKKYYTPQKQAGKTRCKWGGTVSERDCFDPLFFNLSPWEAESMSPHQRLVLQEGWKAIENAGYNPKDLSGSKTGVFIGVEPTSYYGDTFTGYSDAIIPSRLSYILNLRGPAIAINTGCSASGVALHLACESLRNKETNMALAGGVNACMDHLVQVRLDEIEMLSPKGRCYTFDERGSGTIISEGIGMVFLKRLDDAIASNDYIYGVICGSGTNQDGASNGVTAPNGAAQEELIIDVYNKYGINPEDITYVEAHGTGTKLGDPVEANALVRAYKKFTSKDTYCSVGSAKSHVGHTGAAAAITGLIKVIMSLKHKQIPKLLHFNQINPLIEFANSPFYITTQTSEWKAPENKARMAALNSFGHSGTNVHLVVKEYIAPTNGTHRETDAQQHNQVIIPLSAKTMEQLKQKVIDLSAYIRSSDALNLTAMAYTLQTGREAMNERIGFIVNSVTQLDAMLHSYINGEPEIKGFFKGQVKRSKNESPFNQYSDLEETIQRYFVERKYTDLLELWVHGAKLDWNALYPIKKPHRICLPSYPFAKERYWYSNMDSPEMKNTQWPAVDNTELNENLKTIEDVFNQIDNDSIEKDQALHLLKTLL